MVIGAYYWDDMKDIENAIKAEKEYLEARRKGKNYNFPSKIREFGFKSVEDFIFNKRGKDIKSLGIEVKHYPHNEAVEKLMEAVKDERYIVVVSDSPEGVTVVYGGDNDNSELECQSNGIPYHYMNRDGGTVVCGSGDFGFGIVLPKDIEGTWIVKMLYDILKPYSKGFSIQGNDIMLYDKKVAGYGKIKQTGNVSAFTVFISFEDNVGVIQQVCKKIGKTPGFIDDHILTKKQFEKDLKLWLKRK